MDKKSLWYKVQMLAKLYSVFFLFNLLFPNSFYKKWLKCNEFFFKMVEYYEKSSNIYVNQFVSKIILFKILKYNETFKLI